MQNAKYVLDGRSIYERDESGVNMKSVCSRPLMYRIDDLGVLEWITQCLNDAHDRGDVRPIPEDATPE